MPKAAVGDVPVASRRLGVHHVTSVFAGKCKNPFSTGATSRTPAGTFAEEKRKI